MVDLRALRLQRVGDMCRLLLVPCVAPTRAPCEYELEAARDRRLPYVAKMRRPRMCN